MPIPPSENQNVVMAQQVLFIEEVSVIGETVCRECSGFGHTRKHCHTYKRLQTLSGGVAPWKYILVKARQRIDGENTKVLLGKRMKWV